MKKRIRRVVVPIFLSLLGGFACGKIMFSIYEDKSSNILNSSIIYLLLDNTYNNYDTMKASTLSNNYIYYEEDGKYNTIIGITKDKDNINIIEKAYNKDLKVKEYILKDEDINNKIKEYDNILKNTKDNNELIEVINKMLSIYKDKEDTKVMKIS